MAITTTSQQHTIETQTQAAVPTLQEAVHLAGTPKMRLGLQKKSSKRRNKDAQERTQNVVQDERREARQLAEKEYRKRRVKAMHGKYDEISDSNQLNAFPRFRAQEIFCGDKLGNGAFGTVYEVTRIVLDSSSPSCARSFMAEHCLRDSSDRGRNPPVRKLERRNLSSGSIGRRNGSTRSIEAKKVDDEEPSDSRYAIKKLRSKIIKGDKEMFAQAMIDVGTETRILASIPHHPNIIKLRGFAYTEGSSGQHFPSCCFHEDFFLVLDRLYGTLDDRLAQWFQQDSQRSFGQILFSKQRKGHPQERLVACLDLASALAHLHKHNIIHRDIKPPNIGFNIRGDLTVFDFGLSRELPHDGKSHKDKANSKLFLLTGFCGSPRYMAPEVGLKKLYNAKCDVYSFGLLAWQILTLQKPFDGCDINDLKNVVWSGNRGVFGPDDWIARRSSKSKDNSDSCVQSKPQPKSKRNIFSSFRSDKNSRIESRPKSDIVMKMIQRTFRRNIAARPTMMDLEAFLKKECEMITAEGDDRKQPLVRDYSARRSTFVFQPQAEKSRRTRRSSVPASEPKMEEDRRSRRSSMPSNRRKTQRSSNEDLTHHGSAFGHSSDSSIMIDFDLFAPTT